MDKLFLLISVLNIVIISSARKECPSNEELHPCKCVGDDKDIRVDCLSITSVDDLKKGLQSTKGIDRVFVDFIRARLEYIPSDLFKGLHVTKLSFTNCDLKQFGDAGRSAFEGLEDVIEELSFHFSFSEENELKYLNVSGLNALEDLQIEGNELSKLGNDWFKDGPVNLNTLFLMTNFIEELGDKAFSNLAKLRNLWLTGNRFKTLKRSMFPSPAKYLVSLDLTDNGITSLPDDIFSGMPSLKEVVLAENGITKIPSTTWSSVWKQLTRVYLEMNPLECDSHIEWMFKVERPFVLKGQCIGPRERKNQDLKKIIDDYSKDENDPFFIFY